MTEAPRIRPAWAEVDLGAVARNAERLAGLVAPARLCAVVKADGYGHGALAVATAALGAGAEVLAVALVEEGIELRRGGAHAPILLLSEPPAAGIDQVIEAGLVPTVYSLELIEELGAAAAAHRRTVDVHLKVDTGMHRVGAPEHEALERAVAVMEHPALRLTGIWTHFAVADGEGDEERAFTGGQLARFTAVADAVEVERERRAPGTPRLVRHAANSAAAMAHPGARLDLVRCGIALYGLAPSPAVGTDVGGGEDLEAALTLRAEVTAVRRLEAGARPSYGRRRALPEAGTVATVPLGYADGVPRRLFEAGGEVLVGGRRRPLAGVVTMDQIVVDCGDLEVRVGDPVVLIGTQGGETIGADEWAGRLGTINYEIVCGIGPRVPRRYRGGPGQSRLPAG